MPRGPSPFWGEEAIWDGHTSNHNPIIDEKGRVWFAARIRPPTRNPDWCKEGGDHPSAQGRAARRLAAPLSVYDPKTQQVDLIETCFSTHHLYFGYDEEQHAVDQRGPAGERRGRLAEHATVRRDAATREGRRAGRR